MKYINKSFRVGMDAKRAYHNTTGLGVYSRKIIDALTRFYPQIHLILFNPKPSSKYNFGHKEILPTNLISKKFHSLWRSFFVGFEIKEKIDIYHGLSAELPFKLPIKIKKIVTIHDLLFERYPKDYPFFDRFMYRIKARYACKIADKIIAVSETTKRDLIDFYHISPNKIVVIGIPFQMDSNIKSKPLELKKPFVVCIASFMARKNQWTLLKAFEKIANQIDFDLVLVGNPKGLYYTKIVREIDKSLFKNRIHVLSQLSNSEIKWLYKNALFSVYPSYYEGFGIPVLESIYYECPILASNISPTREISENIPLFFAPNSIEDLAYNMKELTMNLETYKKNMVQSKSEVLEKFSDKIIIEHLYTEYEKLILNSI